MTIDESDNGQRDGNTAFIHVGIISTRKLAGGGKFIDLKSSIRILSRRHGDVELIERLLKANRIPEASMVIKGMSRLIKLRYTLLISKLLFHQKPFQPNITKKSTMKTSMKEFEL